MLYSHPALVQNSYWNPGQPCQVVINYCGSWGSVLQTDLRELRAFSSRICFQDRGCGAAELSTKGTDPMSCGSATLVPLQPRGAHKPSTAVFLGRQGGGQQGNCPAQAALPWTQRFPGQNNFLLVGVQAQLSRAGEGHSSALLLWSKGRELGFEEATTAVGFDVCGWSMEYFLPYEMAKCHTGCMWGQKFVDMCTIYCISSTRKSLFYYKKGCVPALITEPIT